MSVFDRQGAILPQGSNDGNSEEQGQNSEMPAAESRELMGDGDAALGSIPVGPELDPHKDARSLVRLVQCQRCSLPLRQPFTLSCGNSLCRECIPQTHRRENITYPMTVGRLEGFLCPFADCAQEHSLADCARDVTLAKVLDRVSIEVAKTRPLTSNTPTMLDERPRWRNIVDSSALKDTLHSRVLSGGRLLATYTLAELGELKYDSEVSYQPMPPSYDDYQHLDVAMLEHLKESTRSELDCNLCYALMLDPITTSCGHTYCRKCVARVLDHSQLCPECRRPLHMSPAVLNEAPTNKRLSKLLLALCAEHVAARAEAAEVEEAAIAQAQWVPLFVCTLAYPQIPTFLHIFEPRYRLMIRRAMEHDRMFGMLAYNGRQEPQGDLGRTQFMRYGTMLEIINLQLLEDGRSLIETRGVSRFCVTDHTMRDGYIVGRVQRVDDLPLAEEEALEAAEVSASLPASQPAMSSSSVQQTQQVPQLLTPPSSNPHQQQLLQQQQHQPSLVQRADTTTVVPETPPPEEASPPPPTQSAPVSAPPPTISNSPDNRPLTALTTSELHHIGVQFIERMHAASAPWLSHSATGGYGAMPADPAIFPYWFASVLPIDDSEKYRLLKTNSVRQRLQICASWVRRVERMRWLASLRFTGTAGSRVGPASSSD